MISDEELASKKLKPASICFESKALTIPEQLYPLFEKDLNSLGFNKYNLLLSKLVVEGMVELGVRIPKKNQKKYTSD